MGDPTMKHLLPLLLALAQLLLLPACHKSATVNLGSTDAGSDSDADSDSEAPPACVYYVDVGSPLGGDGTTWESAVDTVQQGIDLAVDMVADSDVCHVWVAEGAYNIYEDSAEDTVLLKPGVHVYGGFAGDETSLSERDWKEHPTVLSGLQDEGSSNRVCHVVTGADDSVLDGFVITDGDCPEIDGTGGGMLNAGAAPTVRNCDFIGNEATVGGGMFNEDSSPTIIGCRFIGNHGSDGAGMYNHDSTPVIWNSVFARNEGDEEGDGVYNNGSAADILNCVFFENQGCGVREVFGSDSELRSNIFWGNGLGSIFKSQNSHTDVDFCNVQGGFAGNGNIDADPLFVDPDDDDFRLQPDSPCIDAADGTVAPDVDLDGNSRIDDPDSANTGLGPPWVDMGAYEFQP